MGVITTHLRSFTSFLLCFYNKSQFSRSERVRKEATAGMSVAVARDVSVGRTVAIAVTV
jgi:hypothetical protein